MYIKYNSINQFEPLVMTLCNPGSMYINGAPTRAIGMISNTSDEEILANFNAVSELNFAFYRAYNGSDEDNDYIKLLYDALQPRRLVFVKGIGYFSIDSAKESYDNDGVQFKDIRAVSIEKEIENKTIPYIADDTYRFKGENENSPGLIEKLVSHLPMWTLGHVDDAVASRYRTFEDVSESLNILGFLYEEVQDAYECIFIFDTINRIINVYDQNDYVVQTDILLTRDDVVQATNVEENSEDLYTAMSVLGGENVVISSVNPTGMNTIYDFSHYISWMDSGLGEKVTAWQTAVAEKEAEYYNLNLSCYTKMDEVANHRHEIEALEQQLVTYRKCKENIIASSSTESIKDYNKVIAANGGTEIDISDSIDEAIAQITDLIAICDSKRANELTMAEELQAEIDIINGSISSIRDPLSMNTYFTENEFEDLQNYIFEGSYSDDYVTFTDVMTYSEKFEQMKTLYDRAKKTLNKAAHPLQKFEVDTENFIFVKKFEHWCDQLEVGCLINVELSDGDIAPLFLSNFTINYDDHTLSMTFGNRFKKFDSKALFEDVLGNINKSSNSLGFIKDTIYPIKDGKLNKMQEEIDSSRSLTLDTAMSSTGEDVTIDGTGYTGRKKLDTGDYDPRQIKINGRNIVFTDDAWETCKTAIGEIVLGDNASTYGVNAETLIGELIVGSNLKIVDGEGNDMFEAVDGRITAELSNYDDKLTNIEATAGNLQIEVTELSRNAGKATTVTTSSGYTFDKDGLTIHKSGDEMTNLLDNTGMYVKRSGTTILEANNEGVIAINLTAQQYLHVGKYSRFEDFKTDEDPYRTACFYVKDLGGN